MKQFLVISGVIAAIAAGSGQTAPASTALSVAGRLNQTPWVAASGRHVAVVWGAATPAGKTDVFAATSRDAGRTFSSPVRVNAVEGEARLGGELPPRVSLGRVTATGDPTIAVLWTARDGGTAIRIARSVDGGRTFGAAETLQTSGAPGDRGWPALTLDAAGVAHAIWLDHRGLAPPPGSAPHKDHRQAGEHDGVAMAQKSGLYYAASGGAASASERSLTNGVCYCCKTALAAGANNMLFAAWRHVYPGNLRDIAFAVSRDGGRTFSTPARINEDRWAINGCPDDGPAMAIDAKGTVHLVWPTVIGGAEPRGGIFYTSTRDGRLFTPRVEVPTLGSPKPSHPQIAVDSAGRLMIAWDESVSGRRVAAARTFAAGATGAADAGPVIRLDDAVAATYPVLAPIDRGFVAAWTSGTGDRSVIRVRAIDGTTH